MPRKQFESMLAEIIRLGLLDEAIEIMQHLLEINRIVESVKTKRPLQLALERSG